MPRAADPPRARTGRDELPDVLIAVVHYHLQTGGVTRVIRHAAEALRGRGVSVVVLTGTPPPRPEPFEVRVVPGLQYEATRPDLSAAELTADLTRAATGALGAAPDLWHFHNHSLGKNLLVPECVKELALRGDPLLLQIHDFPEDGRPANYRALRHALVGDRPGASLMSATLYPLGDHVHYAVLGTRDARFLGKAGAPDTQVHILPNAVSLGPHGDHGSAHRKSAERLWLYPTRAICRKNLGEFLLWAALGREDDRFATTRGPENPAERPAYDAWRAFATELALPVEFGVGERTDDFESLLVSAHAMVTTSVAEGFGLAFLEPWLMDRAIAGRDLPEQTDDFRSEGIDLDHLYRTLLVPLDWVGERTLRKRAARALDRTLSSYGRTAGPDDEDRALAAWTRSGRVDFGRLDQALQKGAIERVTNSPDARTELAPSELELPGAGVNTVSRNRRIIAQRWGIDAYGERLAKVYEALLARPAGGREGGLDGDRLLDQFLAPERLWLLRS